MAKEGSLFEDDDEPRGSGVAFRRAQHCPECSSRFSSEGRFCPYDGTPLVPAPDYDPLADPLLGQLIDDRYAVIRVLGEGGMGTVYEVRHDKLERHFALKALRRDLARDGELSQRFIQEARATAAVAHPGIVQITDFGTLETGQPYFVMELLRGRPLTTILRDEGPLEVRRAVGLVRALAEALRAAHAARIIHRDLKPDNVHVFRAASGSETVKILDFGLARVGSGSRLTKDGFVFGTPHYMSPEQASGEPIDHRADIYSLGVLMYELFTGTLPFEADTSMGVLTKHIYMDPVPPSQVRPDVALGAPMERIILKCLEKQPAKRFRDMDDLLAHLERADAALAADEDGRSLPEERTNTNALLARVSEPPRFMEIGWVSWLAGAAGLAALALAGALLMGPSRERVRQANPQAPVRALLPAKQPPQRAVSVPDSPPPRRVQPLPGSTPTAQQGSTPVHRPAHTEGSEKHSRQPASHAALRPSASAVDSAAQSDQPTPPPRATPPTEVIDPWAE